MSSSTSNSSVDVHVTSSSDEDTRKRKKRKRSHSSPDPPVAKHKKKKRKPSSPSTEEKRHGKRKEKTKSKKRKKVKKKKHRKRCSSSSSDDVKLIGTNKTQDTFGPSLPNVSTHNIEQTTELTTGTSSIASTTTKRNYGPMTLQDHEKKQNIVRRVTDPDTGRSRLVKGDGEIIEEIVSKERHKEINKLSTQGDGASFQTGLKRFK